MTNQNNDNQNDDNQQNGNQNYDDVSMNKIYAIHTNSVFPESSEVQ